MKLYFDQRRELENRHANGVDVVSFACDEFLEIVGTNVAIRKECKDEISVFAEVRGKPVKESPVPFSHYNF